ncbi:MAG: N-acetylmuramate alpha-1-phosphate uridylyltransferase MurU, partial [Halothiobacillaceae bacterium]
MNAMILAAGRGERMRPLTDHAPKPMLQVLGKPLIAYHVERLAAAGVERIVINLAHLGKQIEEYFGDGDRFGIPIIYSREPKALETAGGIRQALPLLGDNPFIVVNGDIHCDYHFERLLQPEQPVAPAHLVLTANPDHNPRGDFHLKPDGMLRAVDKTESHPDQKPTYTFTGIARYEPSLFGKLVEGAHGALGPLFRQWA